VAAQEPLDRGPVGRGLGAHLGHLGRHQPAQLVQNFATVDQPAAEHKRAGCHAEQVQPHQQGRRIVGHQPQGGLQPVRRHSGRPVQRGRACLAQGHDRFRVAALR
jgi:hypothetical protein